MWWKSKFVSGVIEGREKTLNDNDDDDDYYNNQSDETTHIFPHTQRK